MLKDEQLFAGIDGCSAIRYFGELPSGTIVTKNVLSDVFGRHPLSIKRAVDRGELPAPTRLLGKEVWTAGAILRHLEKRLVAAQDEAEMAARRFSELSVN